MKMLNLSILVSFSLFCCFLFLFLFFIRSVVLDRLKYIQVHFHSSTIFRTSFQMVAFQALLYKGFWTVVVYHFLNFYSLFCLLLNMLLYGQIFLYLHHPYYMGFKCGLSTHDGIQLVHVKIISSCSTFSPFFKFCKYNSSYEWHCFCQLYSSRYLNQLVLLRP